MKTHKRFINPDTPIVVTERRLLEVQITSEELTDEDRTSVEECLQEMPSFPHKEDNEGIFALLPAGEDKIFDAIYGSSDLPQPVKDALRASQDVNDEEKPEDPGYCLIVLS